MKLHSIQLENYRSFAASGPLELGQITLFVGKNNTGKSTLIRSPLILQSNIPVNWMEEVRRGQDTAKLQFSFKEINWDHDLKEQGLGLPVTKKATIRANVAKNLNNLSYSLTLETGDTFKFNQISHHEPNSYIYPLLSTRKNTHITNEVAEERTNTVGVTVENLNNKVQRLSTRQHRLNKLFEEMCEELIGYPVASIPAPGGGQRAGIYISDTEHLPINVMGEGVVSLLSFITDLCIAENKLFIVEEPENDIHPQALKILMRLIIDSTKRENQFIVSTHNNIVAKYLGSVEGSKIYKTEVTIGSGSVPTSTVKEVEATPEARINLLTSLGYELYDFDIWDGWLILEESTAEQLLTEFIIPEFVPNLGRFRTISVGGNEEAGPVFAEFNRLFRFTHLEHYYRNRAWVILDGDARGRELINLIRQSYPTWDEGNFRYWQEEDFENYYPPRFKDHVLAALSKRGKAKKDAKTELIKDVLAFCKEKPEEARAEFSKSAAEVISKLKALEAAPISRL